MQSSRTGTLARREPEVSHFLVPKHNAEAVGLRKLVGSDEVDEVYTVLKRRGGKISTATWNRRYREYMEKINTGSLVEIATVLRDLCLLRGDKQLSSGEREMLETAIIG